MTDVLTKVKSGLMITGTQFDEVLKIHIEDVTDYLKNAGITQSVIDSNTSVGVILRGVTDLWNNGSGEGKLSPYFYDRASQLAIVGGGKDVPTEGN